MSFTQILLALLTFSVSLMVAMVGYAQWRTANQRVVLDLHQQRREIYERIGKLISSTVRAGKVDEAAFSEFSRAEADAQFFFGCDVLEYLQALRGDFAYLLTFTPDTIRQMPDSAAQFNRRTTLMLRIAKFWTDGTNLFAPYMRMDQKNTPFWRPW